MTTPDPGRRDRIGRAVVRGNWVIIGAAIAAALLAAGLLAAALVIG